MPILPAKSTLRRLGLLILTAWLVAACGSKTGLEAPDIEAGPDVIDATDVTDVQDIPVVPRMVRCYPVRIRTRLGFVVSIRPDTDVLVQSGVEWTLDSRPDGSRASILSDGSLLAAVTPDRVGEYDITATIPTPYADGGRLPCSIVVIADPPDPECPGYAITEPQIVQIPGGDSQVAYDTVFHDPRTASGSANSGVIVADDPISRVATATIERTTSENLSDPMTALAREGERAESAVINALGSSVTTAVLVGRSATTHDQHPIRRSTLRVDTSSTPGSLRDRSVQAIASISPPANPTVETPASQFYVEVVSILRQDTAHIITLVAVSPVATFDDANTQTAIRVNDFANGTSIARTGATTQVRCHAVTATRSILADFLWLVDTSASMNDDQERVGNTAQRFFSDLRLGVPGRAYAPGAHRSAGVPMDLGKRSERRAADGVPSDRAGVSRQRRRHAATVPRERLGRRTHRGRGRSDQRVRATSRRASRDQSGLPAATERRGGHVLRHRRTRQQRLQPVLRHGDAALAVGHGG